MLELLINVPDQVKAAFLKPFTVSSRVRQDHFLRLAALLSACHPLPLSVAPDEELEYGA